MTFPTVNTDIETRTDTQVTCNIQQHKPKVLQQLSHHQLVVLLHSTRVSPDWVQNSWRVQCLAQGHFSRIWNDIQAFSTSLISHWMLERFSDSPLRVLLSRVHRSVVFFISIISQQEISQLFQVLRVDLNPRPLLPPLLLHWHHQSSVCSMFCYSTYIFLLFMAILASLWLLLHC